MIFFFLLLTAAVTGDEGNDKSEVKFSRCEEGNSSGKDRVLVPLSLGIYFRMWSNMTIFSVKFLLSYSFRPVSLNVALMYSQELKKHTHKDL